VPSLLGGPRRHPEVAFNSVSCKDASTATLQTDTNKERSKKSFRISSWRRDCHRLGAEGEILPRAIKSNACASWRTRTSILAIGISVMNKITLGHVEAQLENAR
jgi:hypothetical protein